MAGNTSTKKMYNDVDAPIAGKVSAPKTAKVGNQGGVNDGQMRSTPPEPFGKPMNNLVTPGVDRMNGLYDDIGEKSGFATDGYIDKKDTPYGEAAKFNYLPPGMNIDNQANAEINAMPMRQLVSESYPGDGWMPKPRDVVD